MSSFPYTDCECTSCESNTKRLMPELWRYLNKCQWMSPASLAWAAVHRALASRSETSFGAVGAVGFGAVDSWTVAAWGGASPGGRPGLRSFNPSTTQSAGASRANAFAGLAQTQPSTLPSRPIRGPPHSSGRTGTATGIAAGG